MAVKMELKMKELSVFFPTYNEEKNIAKVVKDTKKVLEKVADKWEIIIVNDGSKDNTREVAEKLAKKHKGVRVISHKVNRGYGGALKTGYKSARFEWVAFIDSDGQFDFSEIAKFIKKQKQTDADLILGIRGDRADSAFRKFATFIWSKLLPRLLLGLKVADYSCGFKMIRKKVFTKVQPLVAEEKVTQIEMLVKAQRLGFKFAEVKVNHYPRKHGSQTGADFKVIKKSIIDLLTLWKQLRKQNA
jgi:glycosyltransferase involved in cell wall biosynthesis